MIGDIQDGTLPEVQLDMGQRATPATWRLLVTLGFVLVAAPVTMYVYRGLVRMIASSLLICLIRLSPTSALTLIVST